MAGWANRLAQIEHRVVLAVTPHLLDQDVVAGFLPFEPGLLTRAAPEPRLPRLQRLLDHLARRERRDQQLAGVYVLRDRRDDAIRTEVERVEPFQGEAHRRTGSPFA